MLRRNEQLLTGEQLDPNNPDTFIYYTGNARSGYNYGLESTLAWTFTANSNSAARWACWQTKYRGFEQNDVVLPESRIAERAVLAGISERHLARPARPLRAVGRDRHGRVFLRPAAQ